MHSELSTIGQDFHFISLLIKIVMRRYINFITDHWHVEIIICYFSRIDRMYILGTEIYDVHFRDWNIMVMK